MKAAKKRLHWMVYVVLVPQAVKATQYKTFLNFFFVCSDKMNTVHGGGGGFQQNKKVGGIDLWEVRNIFLNKVMLRNTV